MIPLARSSLESMTPLGELISVTAIERELSITHRVCSETLFRFRKKPNPINNIPIIINDHRRSRLRGDMKKLTGEDGIYLFYIHFSESRLTSPINLPIIVYTIWDVESIFPALIGTSSYWRLYQGREHCRILIVRGSDV